jgi:hypothetical protein
MSKKHQQQKSEEHQPQEGVIAGDDQGAVQEEQSAESDAGADTSAEQSTEQQEAPAEDVKPISMGIGQFVRWMLKNTSKTNAEILELTLKTFEGSKTTAACIAWYKTDMRKKGLLTGGAQRGKAKVIELSAEDLEQLAK